MKKLWLRIFVAFFSLIILVLSCVGFFVGDTMKNTYFDMTRQQLSRDAEVITSVVTQNDIHHKDIQSKLQRLYKNKQPRITVIDLKGKVMADSDENPKRMENHFNRPEVHNVITSKKGSSESIRYSETLHYNMMYVAKPIYNNKHQKIGVIRAAFTLEKIDHAIKELWGTLAIALVVALIIAGLVAIRLSKGISRPIEAIVSVAEQLTTKNYASRVKTKTTGEIQELSIAINVLAESLQRQMEDIHHHQQQLNGILTNMFSGVMLTDPVGKITLVNPAFEDIVETSEDALIGKLHLEAGKNIGLSQLIQQSVKNNTNLHEEITIQYPKKRILDVHVAPIRGYHQEIQGIVTVLHDITTIRYLESIRSEFVANVSHELKTPVTSVKGFAETLLDGAMYNEEVCRNFLEIIYKESDRLHRLISDILNLSNIEQSHTINQQETVFLSQLIRDTTKTLQETILKKNLHMQLPDDSNISIRGNRDQCQQLLLNLIANAVNYTPPDGTITIGLTEFSNQIKFTVSDTGIGISKAHVDRIFERFYRVDKARSRNSGGTGLGLAIVKHLVELYKGTIRVESEEGKGTTFIVTLPK